MSKEQANERIKAIREEQRKIDRIGLVCGLVLTISMVGGFLSRAAMLPAFLDHGMLYNAMALISAPLFIWVIFRSRRCYRDRDALLAKHGIW